MDIKKIKKDVKTKKTKKGGSLSSDNVMQLVTKYNCKVGSGYKNVKGGACMPSLISSYDVPNNLFSYTKTYFPPIYASVTQNESPDLLNKSVNVVSESVDGIDMTTSKLYEESPKDLTNYNIPKIGGFKTKSKKLKTTRGGNPPTTTPTEQNQTKEKIDGIVHNKQSCLKVPRTIAKVRCIEAAFQRRVTFFLKEYKDDEEIQNNFKEFIKDFDEILNIIDADDTAVCNSTPCAQKRSKKQNNRSANVQESTNNANVQEPNAKKSLSIADRMKLLEQKNKVYNIQRDKIIIEDEKLSSEANANVLEKTDIICKKIDDLYTNKYRNSTDKNAEKVIKVDELNKGCKEVLTFINVDVYKNGGGKMSKKVINKLRIKLTKIKKALKMA
jgi:hypothetical protein